MSDEQSRQGADRKVRWTHTGIALLTFGWGFASEWLFRDHSEALRTSVVIGGMFGVFFLLWTMAWLRGIRPF
jgi:hypothetical protein